MDPGKKLMSLGRCARRWSGSYPFPAGWSSPRSTSISSEKRTLAEAIDDATRIAIADQVDAGLDIISDGEQTRFDFNLSFYGYLEGISIEPVPRAPLTGRLHTISAANTK